MKKEMKKEDLVNYCKDEMLECKKSLVELRDNFCGDVITTEKYIQSADEQYKKLYIYRALLDTIGAD